MVKPVSTILMTLALLIGSTASAQSKELCGVLTGIEMSLEALTHKQTWKGSGLYPSFYGDEIAAAAKMYTDNRMITIVSLGKNLGKYAESLDGKERSVVETLAKTLTEYRSNVEAYAIRRSYEPESVLTNQDAAIKGFISMVSAGKVMSCD